MKRRIKIAHLISPIPIYGKEKWLFSFLKYCDRDRFEHIVIPLTNEGNASFCDFITGTGIECTPVRMNSRYNFNAHRDMISIIRSREIDIIHSHDYKSDFMAFLLKYGTGVRAISTPHGWSSQPNIKLQIFQWIDRLCIGFFDRVVPLSHHMAGTVKTVRRRKLHVIENFVDVSDLPNSTQPSGKLFSYIGRLTKLKRIEDALEALLYTSSDEVKLQVIGDGPSRSWLEGTAKDLGVQKRVDFYGFRDDRLELLNRSIALILPSLTEGISRVAMEAMALRKPVIGTDIPGISVLVEDGKTGFLIPARDPRSIAGAIDTCIDSPDMVEEMGERARETIIERFSAPSAVKRYERLYEGLVS